jgi:hypothetical protein
LIQIIKDKTPVQRLEKARMAYHHNKEKVVLATKETISSSSLYNK